MRDYSVALAWTYALFTTRCKTDRLNDSRRRNVNELKVVYRGMSIRRYALYQFLQYYIGVWRRNGAMANGG